MQAKFIRVYMPAFVILLIAMLACNLSAGGVIPPSPTQGQAPLIPVAGQTTTPTAPPSQIPATATVVVTHIVTPSAPLGGKLVSDVNSSSTAPEKRAPYGDSYSNNLLERPFTQDMTYVPDLDISNFTVAKDNNWWYVSIKLVGANPNNTLGIDYGVILDTNHDGFGDYLIWAHPPYTNQWETAPVQIYQDKNHDTGGLSAAKSDAPFNGDGYETLIFDGSQGGNDPDLAWVRINAGPDATVQFAFKRSWSGNLFMLGVIADAGLKDPKKMDYVDRFTIAEAGSPLREDPNYPLKALSLVDNTCREAFGFQPTFYIPQGCPLPPTPTPKPRSPRPNNTPAPTPAGVPTPVIN